MPLSDLQKRAMIVATHEAALNMAEDLAHMRDVIGKMDISSGDLRRLSNLLRRLLIDNGGDLRKISPPRLSHRLMFLAPLVKKTYASASNNLYTFASIGESGIYGLPTDDFFIRTIFTPSRPSGSWRIYREPALIGQKEQTIQLTLDRFLSQRVLYYYGQWISRGEIIKYIANIAGGVHSEEHKSHLHAVLRRIRNFSSIKIINGRARWIGDIAARDSRIDIERDGIDFVLIQLMAAARYLTISPDVTTLETIIQHEKV